MFGVFFPTNLPKVKCETKYTPLCFALRVSMTSPCVTGLKLSSPYPMGARPHCSMMVWILETGKHYLESNPVYTVGDEAKESVFVHPHIDCLGKEGTCSLQAD